MWRLSPYWAPTSSDFMPNFGKILGAVFEICRYARMYARTDGREWYYRTCGFQPGTNKKRTLTKWHKNIASKFYNFDNWITIFSWSQVENRRSYNITPVRMCVCVCVTNGTSPKPSYLKACAITSRYPTADMHGCHISNVTWRDVTWRNIRLQSH